MRNCVLCSVFLLILSGCSAHVVEAPDVKPIVPPGMEWTTEDFHFSPAVVSGDFVFLSGVVAVQTVPDGKGMAAAIDNAFKEIALVLEQAGSDWDHVVDMTTYHVELEQQKVIFQTIKDKYVKPPYPAWTAVDVDALWVPTGIVEIKVTARLR